MVRLCHYPCDNCSKIFKSKWDLKRHKRTHSNHRPHRCPHCQKRFKLLGNLKVHIKRHNNVKMYKCDHCSMAFVSSSERTSHIRTHTHEQPFACLICSKRFSLKGNLTKHQSVHNGLRLHKCASCTKSFVSTSDLKRHKRVHTKEKPFACERCHKRFALKGGLKKHEWYVHRLYSNLKCQKICVNTNNVHLGEKEPAYHTGPDRLNYCSMCFYYKHPNETKSGIRQEVLVLAELQRRIKHLRYPYVWDCVPPNSCSIRKRPDMLWYYGQWYLHVEIDERGSQHENSYDRLLSIQRALTATNNNGPPIKGLVLRINPNAKGGRSMLKKSWLASCNKRIWYAKEPYFSQQMQTIETWLLNNVFNGKVTTCEPPKLSFDKNGLYVHRFFFENLSVSL